jgi:murein L,D-transpeptidase YafK
MKKISLILLTMLVCQDAAWAAPAVELVRVLKSERKLQLISGGKIRNEFNVALGSNPKGPKQQEGDGRTPEGKYTLNYKKKNSGYFRAIHISYPNRADRKSAKARGVKPGGDIMIHGQKRMLGWMSPISQQFDWTKGCIALSDEDMEVVWKMVREGTKIEILP